MEALDGPLALLSNVLVCTGIMIVDTVLEHMENNTSQFVSSSNNSLRCTMTCFDASIECTESAVGACQGLGSHAQSVVRAAERALVVVDLPFGSYQGDSKNALMSSIRIMKESGAHAVKLEGGIEVIESVGRILTAGIPVMGHLGLTPQSIYKFGTYSVRAKEEEEAEKLLSDAKALEKAGCFSLVLEKIPRKLAKRVAESIEIPVIGIGAGPDVDGQVLVLHDMLGMTHEFHPRFLRRYLSLFEEINGAVKQYVADVKSCDFPNKEESYGG